MAEDPEDDERLPPSGSADQATASALDDLTWDDRGLLPTVVQDRHTGEIRMVAWANRAAVEATLATGQATFFSRSRQALWRKGETSGHTLDVAEIWTDCDRDVLLYLADPHGPTCHLGTPTCFQHPLSPGAEGRAAPTLLRLEHTLEARKAAPRTGGSYTQRLLDGGAEAVGAKLREEAGELSDALQSETDDRVWAEAADLAYHALVGLVGRGLDHRGVLAELARRFGLSGLVEKARRRAPVSR